jgi:hypothetical protein
MRVPILALVLASFPLPAGDVQVGAGVFLAAREGSDFMVTLRPGGPWSFGYRYVRWLDVSHDPFTERSLSNTTETRSGPVVTYRFRPEARGSWYLRGALYRYTKEEKSLVYGDTSRSGTTAPAVGGGYTGALGRWFYWDLGMLLSPGGRLNTQTSTGSEQDSGLFDVVAQVGFRFR